MHKDFGGFLSAIFASPLERKLVRLYRAVFSVDEIETTPLLQIALGALLLSMFVGLSRWFYSPSISVSSYLDNDYTCWAYFQECGRWYFLEALPFGYSQSLAFMALFACMALAAYCMYKKEWALAHVLILLVWLCKVVTLFVLTQQLAANYDYYDTLLLAVVLLLPHKLFFARLSFVLFYFLASTIKIHEGWILGSYFTSLATGLPIFGNAAAPIVTNAVIFMQIIGSWLLLSRNRYLHLLALFYFISFHLYSGILVGYRYPTVALVMLLVLFGIKWQETKQSVPMDRRSLAGWCFVALLCVAQFLSISIPGDQKLTLEGNYYGLFMFEANHQCVSRTVTHFRDGTTRERVKQSMDSKWRCDPYEYWFAIQNNCKRDESITSVEWRFDHSINGNPFYRIVDTEDACKLTYKPLTHNEWIRLPEDGAQVVGYALENFYER